MEAEYQAMCVATCEEVWLRRLLQDVGEEQRDATTIRCDNQSSIKLANNPVFHKNTKHIDTQFHFVQGESSIKKKSILYIVKRVIMLLTFSLSLLEKLSLKCLGRC